jgi:hypothetical protein
MFFLEDPAEGRASDQRTKVPMVLHDRVECRGALAGGKVRTAPLAQGLLNLATVAR